MVLVWSGDHATAVLPDKEKDLGRIGENQRLVASARQTPRGVEYDVTVTDAET